MAGGGRGRRRGGGSGSRGRQSTVEEEEEIVTEDLMVIDDQAEAEDQSDEGVPQVQVRYTEDGKKILEPTGLWFMDDHVVRAVTKSTKTNFVGEIPTAWSYASAAQKEAWLNNFRESFAWHESLESSVRERYNEVGTRRYRDVIYKTIRRSKEPQNMKGEKYEGLIKHTQTESFQKRSKQASLNKKGGKKDAVVEPTHYGGSRSFWDILLGKGKKKAKTVKTAPELFLGTHSRVDYKGIRTWTKSKDKDLYDAFENTKAANPEKEDNDIWFELVKGFNKGNVYGTGSSASAFYEKTTRRRSTSTIPSNTYQPGVISQLQSQIRERDERDKARDEELRQMKERMAMFKTWWQGCNTGPRPDYDPMDPHGPGGGSGADVGLPVVK